MYVRNKTNDEIYFDISASSQTKVLSSSVRIFTNEYLLFGLKMNLNQNIVRS